MGSPDLAQPDLINHPLLSNYDSIKLIRHSGASPKDVGKMIQFVMLAYTGDMSTSIDRKLREIANVMGLHSQSKEMISLANFETGSFLQRKRNRELTLIRPMVDFAFEYVKNCNIRAWNELLMDEVLFWGNFREILLPVNEVDNKVRLEIISRKKKLLAVNQEVMARLTPENLFGNNKHLLSYANDQLIKEARKYL